MAFEAFRKNGGPTYYDAVHTPFEADLVTSGLIFCFCILGFSFYIILPGVVGKEKIFMFIRTTASLLIGAVILVSNFSQTWEVAETTTTTKYRAGTGKEVNVTIGVQIGFRGVNITLEGDKDQIKGETINYNENFNWEGLQGRLGFGPYAGEFNQEYRAAQFRGLPLPILWIAEYFTLDGEGIRWGRHYRQAGWYSHIILWLAFPLWLLANILFYVLLRYGAYFLVLTGLSMITSNIIWATLRNVNELVIPFTEHDKLEFSYGGSFWVCLITGIICVILGIIIFFMDKLFPSAIAVFFGVDVLQDSESVIVVEDDEPEKPKDNGHAADGNGVAGPSNEEANDEDDDDLYLPVPQQAAPNMPDRAKPYVVRPPSAGKSIYRSGEHRFTKKIQRPRRRTPPPQPPRQAGGSDEDDNLYQNAPAVRPRHAAPPPPLGNRQSLAEDDLQEKQANIEMVNFQAN